MGGKVKKADGWRQKKRRAGEAKRNSSGQQTGEQKTTTRAWKEKQSQEHHRV